MDRYEWWLSDQIHSEAGLIAGLIRKGLIWLQVAECQRESQCFQIPLLNGMMNDAEEKLLKTLPRSAPGTWYCSVPGTWPLLVKSNKVHSPVKATYESPS